MWKNIDDLVRCWFFLRYNPFEQGASEEGAFCVFCFMEGNMNIIYKGLEEIRPYANNPRNNDDAVEAVANSIKEFGFKVPIIIDKNGEIIAGHTRYKASMRLGLTEVPCIIADDLTDEQVKAFRIADNKVAEIATWDYELLDIELGDISIDMSDFGLEKFEFGSSGSHLREQTSPEVKEGTKAVCPCCGFEFEV